MTKRGGRTTAPSVRAGRTRLLLVGGWFQPAVSTHLDETSYTREDFTTGGPRYDLIFDNVENRSLADLRRVLKPNGTLLLNSGTGATGLRFIVRLINPLVISPFVSQTLRRFVSMPNLDLEHLKALVEDGKLRPVIERTYPLSETPAALRHIEAGHARGKVVVSV